MSNVILSGYRTSERRRWPIYVLSTDSGHVETRWFRNDAEYDAIGPKHGLGDYRRIGSIGSGQRGFFAVYANEQSLYLWINGQQLDLLSDPVTVVRSTIFWGLHAFRVTVHGNALFETRYWYMDWEDMPDLDFFWYMGRSLTTREERVRTLLYWQDSAQGISGFSQAYRRDLEQRARVLMSRDRSAG